MIYVSENKAQIVKGDFHPAELYKGDKKIAGYGVEAFEGEGVITLSDCHNDRLYNIVFTGSSEENIRLGARGKNILKAPLDLSSWEKGVLPSRLGYAYMLGDFLTENISVTLSFKCNAVPMYLYFMTDDEDIPAGAVDQETGIRIVYLITTSVVSDTLTFTPKKDKIYALYCARSSTYATKEAAQEWLDRFSYIQLETGDKATDFEEYVEPQTFDVCVDEIENVVFPTFKGTTVYEISAENPVRMSGMYKRTEV